MYIGALAMHVHALFVNGALPDLWTEGALPHRGRAQIGILSNIDMDRVSPRLSKGQDRRATTSRPLFNALIQAYAELDGVEMFQC